MSVVSKVGSPSSGEIVKYDDTLMTTLAAAKTGTEEAQGATKKLNTLVQDIKHGLSADPSAKSLTDAKALLIRLRDSSNHTHGLLTQTHKQLREATTGIANTIFGTPESRELYSRRNTVAEWTRTFEGNLKSVTKLEETLGKQVEGVKARALSVKLPERAALSNVELKQHMPPAGIVSINGKTRDSIYGMFETLFEALSIPQDKAVLDFRANTFGAENVKVPDLKGADINVLKNADMRRFDDVAEALKARCDSKKVRETGLAFFTPVENKEVRMISIETKADKTATIRLESTFALSREEGQEAIATVTATYTVQVAADGSAKTSCIFNNVQPIAGMVKLSDLQKLKDIFPDTVKINAPAAASTAN